ncbi:PREDICTED: protein trichome birefringence-like 33 [Ipomoea nil]|uniref:protein trichome birefringence-like 33 n=1 Tax=Ipomoea nil TaxID=35883 RepID=UPI0009013853|nr:PREDICTED: protein trichome birefringence-like 33 [Ipomoea nil]
MTTKLESSNSSFFFLKKTVFLPYFFAPLVIIVFISLYALVFSPPLFTSFAWLPQQPKKEERLPFAIGRNENGCDIFSGRWVRDEESRPLYKESECPYLQPQQACLASGRPDRDYIYWKWQPNACSLPSFNASLMLEALRGKRMMFAGDSLCRGSFYSMVCLLQKFIPNNAKSIEDAGQRIIFTAKEYNATVEFYWAPLLLESNADDPKKHTVHGRMVRRGSINVHGQHWRGVDILVLQTYIWWFIDDYFKILEGSFEDKVKNTTDVPSNDAYRMALESMLKWVEENMDLTKTRVFFNDISPTHRSKDLWGGDQNGNCYNETTLVEDLNYDVSKPLKKTMRVIDEVLSKSNVQITLLNITRLSNYRKDGHVSIYKKPFGTLTAEELATLVSYADCIHWCSPGVQDIWSELLFAKLFYP